MIFLILICLEGTPLILLELGIGQKLRRGPLGIWRIINPYLGGIGLGSAVISTVAASYYNVLISWCLYYFFNSFKVIEFRLMPTADQITNPIPNDHESFRLSFHGLRVRQ